MIALLGAGCADFDMRSGVMGDQSYMYGSEYDVQEEHLEDVAASEDPYSEENPFGLDKSDPRFYLSETAEIAEKEGNYLAAAGH